MTQFNYTPNLNGLTVIKDESEQFNKFFYKGHPEFLIPDFDKRNNGPQDIWTLYLDFLEANYSCPVYEDDGGEISSHKILDKNTGLTKCVWEAWGITFDEDDEPQDCDVEIEGYVVEDNTGFCYFVATKVFEQYKHSI